MDILRNILLVSLTAALIGAIGMDRFVAHQEAALRDRSFDISTRYDEAVPLVLAEAVRRVETAQGKEEIARWADDMRQMLPEFLTDMVGVQEMIAQDEWGSFSFEPMEAFRRKWEARLQTCPSCEELVPLLTPLTEELFADLPDLSAPRKGDRPFANYWRYFERLRASNPWGLGNLFRSVFLKDQNRSVSIYEDKEERMVNGVKSVFIRDRVVVERGDTGTVFYERVADDEVVETVALRDPVSMLHLTLERLKKEGGDDQLISFLSRIVRIADSHITIAWQQGFMSDLAYHYLYSHDESLPLRVQNQHPLLGPSYHDYKVMEFYPLDPVIPE